MDTEIGAVEVGDAREDDDDDPFIEEDLPENLTRDNWSILTVLQWISLFVIATAFFCIPRAAAHFSAGDATAERRRTGTSPSKWLGAEGGHISFYQWLLSSLWLIRSNLLSFLLMRLTVSWDSIAPQIMRL